MVRCIRMIVMNSGSKHSYLAIRDADRLTRVSTPSQLPGGRGRSMGAKAWEYILGNRLFRFACMLRFWNYSMDA